MPGKVRVGMVGITPNRGFSSIAAAHCGQKRTG
jgi:hypothetical protein